MNSHWYAVANLSLFTTAALDRKKLSKSRDVRQYHICPTCHDHFKKPQGEAAIFAEFTAKFVNHVQLCSDRDTMITELKPPKNPILRFKNYKWTHHARFAIYGDFETTNTPVPDLCTTCFEMYEHANGRQDKARIVQKCKENNHPPDPHNNCLRCRIAVQGLFTSGLTKCILECGTVRYLTPSDEMCVVCADEYARQVALIQHANNCVEEGCIECDGRDR